MHSFLILVVQEIRLSRNWLILVVEKMYVYNSTWSRSVKLTSVYLTKLPASGNPNFHHLAHKRQPMDYVLSWMNAIYTSVHYLKSTLILSSHIRIGLPSVISPRDFPISGVRISCHSYILHLLIIFYSKY